MRKETEETAEISNSYWSDNGFLFARKDYNTHKVDDIEKICNFSYTENKNLLLHLHITSIGNGSLCFYKQAIHFGQQKEMYSATHERIWLLYFIDKRIAKLEKENA